LGEERKCVLCVKFQGFYLSSFWKKGARGGATGMSFSQSLGCTKGSVQALDTSIRFITRHFLRCGIVSTSPNPQAGGPLLVGCPLLLIQYTGIYPANWSCLRHCATSRKVAGSISDGVIGIFHWHNPSGRTVALERNQQLMEMSIMNISLGVKVAGA